MTSQDVIQEYINEQVAGQYSRQAVLEDLSIQDLKDIITKMATVIAGEK